GPRLWRRRASSTCSTSAGKTARTSTACARTTLRRSSRSSAAPACRGGWGLAGVTEPLDLGSLPELDAEAIAVCLLFAFRDPSHERAVADELRRRHPKA